MIDVDRTPVVRIGAAEIVYGEAAERLWPSAAHVERYVSRDAVERLKESFERQAREEASFAVLR